ncbi:MAG: SoxR reducing system RseC family protein [Clostridia bacterium]|nr:SoxR reducing system RseC family protein [Clostridia bacterium]
MERIGEITAVNGDRLEVTFCRPEDCGHCRACDGQEKRTVVSVKGSGAVGDLAAVELPTGTVVKASLLAYALPMAGLMGGMLLGYALFPANMAAAAIAGAVGLAVCLAAVRVTEKGRRESTAWQPTLNRVIPQSMYRKAEEAPQEKGETNS